MQQPSAGIQCYCTSIKKSNSMTITTPLNSNSDCCNLICDHLSPSPRLGPCARFVTSTVKFEMGFPWFFGETSISIRHSVSVSLSSARLWRPRLGSFINDVCRERGVGQKDNKFALIYHCCRSIPFAEHGVKHIMLWTSSMDVPLPFGSSSPYSIHLGRFLKGDPNVNRGGGRGPSLL